MPIVIPRRLPAYEILTNEYMYSLSALGLIDGMSEIDNYAEMLGIADKVREARILKPEPEQQGKGRPIKKGQQVPTNGKHKIVISFREQKKWGLD